MRRATVAAFLGSLGLSVAMSSCTRDRAHAPAGPDVTVQKALEPPRARPPTSSSAEPSPSAPPDVREGAPSDPIPDDLPQIRGGGARVVTGHHGMVVSVEEHATRAGVEILEQGGNAADAAVAVAFALAVTHPSAGNLGGGGFLVYRPHGGPTRVIVFREKAPAAVTTARFQAMLAEGAKGPAAVAVPGTVAGLDLALAELGKLPRTQVLEPAIRLARDGFPLGPWQGKTIAWAFPDLSRDPAARKVFGKHGKPKAAGDLLVQPELARTLRRIAEQGDPGFYSGETARAIAALGSRGGLVTPDDLASYRAVVREPLSVPYRGLTVEVPPPPSAGGAAVAVMLTLLSRLGAEKLPPRSDGELHLFAEVARRAHAIRRFEIGDPYALPAFDWPSRSRALLDADALLARFPPIDPDHATPSPRVSTHYAAAMRELEHTTHLSVVDAEGNAASLTTTLSASFGARVMAAGVVLNNALAGFGTVGENVLAPRREMTTSMSPVIVLAKGEPVMVCGSPGGDTIPNTVVQVLRNVIDHGMTLDDAVDAPRIHHGFVPDEIRFESAHPPGKATLAALRRRGHRLSSPSRAIGDADCIVVSAGVASGYADPREGGLALGPAR